MIHGQRWCQSMRRLRVKVASLHAISRGILLLALLGGARQRVCAAGVGDGLDLLDILAGALEHLEIGRGQVSLAAVAGTALPPLAGLAGRVVLGQDGNEVALAGLELHAVAGLGEEVKLQTAELELGGVDGLLGVELLLLHAPLLLFLRGGEAADHLGHEVGQAKGSEEEED